MTTDRGFIDPISLALYAFVIFVVVLAIGIGVDQWATCKESKTQHCIDYPGGSFEAPTGVTP